MAMMSLREFWVSMKTCTAREVATAYQNAVPRVKDLARGAFGQLRWTTPIPMIVCQMPDADCRTYPRALGSFAGPRDKVGLGGVT